MKTLIWKAAETEQNWICNTPNSVRHLTKWPTEAILRYFPTLRSFLPTHLSLAPGSEPLRKRKREMLCTPNMCSLESLTWDSPKIETVCRCSPWIESFPPLGRVLSNHVGTIIYEKGALTKPVSWLFCLMHLITFLEDKSLDLHPCVSFPGRDPVCTIHIEDSRTLILQMRRKIRF